jgi:hydroxymethylpyrimidine pyrophosphatase-like HAD family hydrolase
LLFTGTSVAMGNGLPEVKAIADYVTTDIDEDGWRNAMVHYGLIKP